MSEKQEAKPFIEPPYDPGKDPQAGVTTTAVRVEDDITKRPRLKILLWGGIPALALIALLWILYNWLGFWVLELYHHYDGAFAPCRVVMDKFPLFLVGKGMLRHRYCPYSPDEEPYDIEEVYNEGVITIAQRGKKAVPFLLRQLRSGNLQVKCASAMTIEEIGPSAKEAVPFLIEALQDESPVMRAIASRALGHVGIGSKQAEEALTERLKDKDAHVRSNASWALGDLGAYSALQFLKKAFESETDSNAKANMWQMIKKLEQVGSDEKKHMKKVITR